MWSAGLDEAQAGIKITGININNLRYADDTTLMAESEEELNSLLMKVKEESKKANLKFYIQKMKIMAFGPITSWQIDRETMENSEKLYFWGSKITVDSDCSHEMKRILLPGRKALTNFNSILKSRDSTLLTKVHIVKVMFFSSSHVRKWELDNKKGWVLTNWWLQTVVLEKTLQSPLNCKEIKPVNSKGNQSWLFIGKTDAEASILLPPDAKSRLIGKDHDAGKDWRQKKKGTTEDEMVGWHYQLSGHEFEQTHLLLLWIPTFSHSITCMSLFYILHLMIPVSETLKTLLETLRS